MVIIRLRIPQNQEIFVLHAEQAHLCIKRAVQNAILADTLNANYVQN